jgi:hypothetical protein
VILISNCTTTQETASIELGKDVVKETSEFEAALVLKKLVPGYMPMGTEGMGMMGEMEMPGPDNALPMMTGDGQFGPLEMGGMFTTVKVREGLSRGDFKDPGWYENPLGRHSPDGRRFKVYSETASGFWQA